MENPAAAFAEKAKAGAFDSLSDEEYEAQLNDVEQENALFGYQKFATSYVIMLKALRRLEQEHIIEISGKGIDFYG